LQPMKADYISENLEERCDDLVWKIKANDQWLYLILMLEFQS